MRRPQRRGYAILLVLTFSVLFLMLLGIAYREIGSVLRTETVRVQQQQSDQGSLTALARGLALLETGTPPSNPYQCVVELDTPAGQRSYTVNFQGRGTTDYTVSAAPLAQDESPPPMPETFAVPPR